MKSAINLEKTGKHYKAWEKYQEFAAKNPQHPRAPEAVFRAGWIAQQHFNDCFMADTFYDEVLTRYPESDPWARAAMLQKNNCPDYFPLVAGSKWTEVDSETKGQNARVEITCDSVTGDPKALPSQAGVLTRQFYAGNKISLSTRATYRKDQMELHEFRHDDDKIPSVLLRWPVEAGAKWSTQIDGRLARLEVVSMSAQASVVAGDFSDCLVVRSSFVGELSYKNDYYAPGVGRVMSTITTPKGEKRITELSSYQITESPDFLPAEAK